MISSIFTICVFSFIKFQQLIFEISTSVHNGSKEFQFSTTILDNDNAKMIESK